MNQLQDESAHSLEEQKNNTRRFTVDQNLLLLMFGIAIFAIMSILKPEIFPTWLNASSMMAQISEVGILSIGMVLAILIGGIDLSVTSIAVLSATFSGMAMVKLASYNSEAAIFLGIAVAVLCGILCGLLNGILIGKLGLPAILVTLGTMTLFSGLAMGVTNGTTINGLPEGFVSKGTGTLFNIPIPFLILGILIFFTSIVLNHTAWGERIYLLGSNAKASLFSGINNTKVTIIVYMVIGFITSLAGLVMMARTNSINPDYGSSYMLQTILVAVVGGVSISGGSGKMSGLFLSLILLQLISTSLNMALYFNPGANFLKNFVWGALLIVIMVLNHVIKH